MATPEKIVVADVRATRKPRRLRLLAPLRYLVISVPEKGRYDFLFPGACSVILTLGFNFLDPKPVIFGPDGFLTSVQSLLTMAVPFLIGALATVAMAGNESIIDRRPAGVLICLDGVVISTRQFMCYLLGYLSFLGFVLLIAIFAANAIRPAFAKWLPSSPVLEMIVNQLAILSLSVLVSAFCVTTLWALYFLTDVVNRR